MKWPLKEAPIRGDVPIFLTVRISDQLEGFLGSQTYIEKGACLQNPRRPDHLVSGTTPSRSLDQRVYQDFLFKLYTLTVNEIYDEYPKINALAELTRLR